jgi:hypothetical protein
MKMRNILATMAVAVAIALPAMAQTPIPVYQTLTASGTTTATVYFATSPSQQARIVAAVASSDLAGANITFRTGVTPLSITKSNAAGATIDVAATNGFAAGDWVILETAAGVITNAVIASFTGATNIVFVESVPITRIGDQIYKASTAVTLWCGVFTNRAYMGEAVYVGNRGRPVMVKVNGTSACSLDSVTARYE